VTLRASQLRAAPPPDWTPPHPDAILTPDQVAAWLQLKHARQVAELGIPTVDLGHKTKRYLARDVYTHIESKRTGGQAA
jgi:hypothetical protein